MDLINYTAFENGGLMELYFNFKAKLTSFNFVLNLKRDERLHIAVDPIQSFHLTFIIGDNSDPSN